MPSSATTPTPRVKLGAEAREIVLGEAQAVLAMVTDEERRGRLASLVAAVDEGEIGEEDAQAAEELLELGLQTGRVRALYGPGGEQAALRIYRQLPRGKQAGEAAREVTQALASLEGKTLESIGIQAVGPAAFVLSVNAGGAEFSVRLDRQGARLSSVGI
jgi:hypothetical protein